MILTMTVSLAGGGQVRSRTHARRTRDARRMLDKAARLKSNAAQARVIERRMTTLREAHPRPRPETARERKVREKAARAQAEIDLRKRRALASACVDYDSRTAPAMRELQVDSLGPNNRVRSLAYMALFDRRRRDATATRVAACATFDSLWHAAHAGDFPEPRFEPQVDSSTPERMHQERFADAKLRLEALRRRLDVMTYALLVERIVRNVRYAALTWIGGVNTLPRRFVEATDVLVEFFGLEEFNESKRAIRAWRAVSAVAVTQ